MLAILDGTVLPADEVRIPATDEGLLRGDGVFEVVRLYDGRPFALDDHLARMERSARNLRLPLDVEAMREELEVLLAADRPGEAIVRILATRGGRRIGLIEPLPQLPETMALKTITYPPTRILDGIKSLSYGANMLASRLAREEGAVEALGDVQEAFLASTVREVLPVHAIDGRAVPSVGGQPTSEAGERMRALIAQ